LSEVLYRKWRPGTLNDLVGQDHITKTLLNAVNSDRISHAYLFCGPRGTGKTSTARILAKSINCESTNQGEPDNNCAQCENINLGRSMDLIEIDGASNRRIADIRELSEKIHYSPTSAKKKVYIIDEVHMLTQEAFNALLKTLEEPPNHAVLILATTDVQKIPSTIVSRCQRFDFKRIPLDAISHKLKLVCESESVDISSDALDLIARKSTGSLRDAENFLEQAIVTFGTTISVGNLIDFFNIDDHQLPIQIMNKLILSDLKGALISVSDFYEKGKDADQILLNMIELARSLILVKAKVVSEKELGESTWKSLTSVASKLEMPDLINMAKIFSAAQLQTSITPTFPLEIGIVQVFVNLRDSHKEISQTYYQVNSTQSKPTPVLNTPHKAIEIKPVNNSPELHPVTTTPPPFKSKPVESKEILKSINHVREGLSGELDSKWSELIKSLRQTGHRFNLGALLRGCHDKDIEGDFLIFKFKHVSHMERLQTEIDNPTVFAELNKVIQDILAKEYKIKIELLNDNQNSNQSPSQKSHLVKTVQAMGARIIEERGK